MKRTLLIVVIAITALIPLAVWARTLSSGLPASAYLYSGGRVLALVGFVMVFYQFVLSSKVRWLERGIGLDRMFAIHRVTGVLALILLVIHPAFLFASDLAAGLIPTITPAKIGGAVTLTLLLAVAGAALLYRRLKWSYETWKRIHLASYLVLPAGLLHSLLFGSDTGGGLVRAMWLAMAATYVAIVVAKLLRLADVRRHPYAVAAVTQETHDTWSLRFQGRPVHHQPGQFMTLQLGRQGRVSESHPFTICTSPTSPQLGVTIKAVGDFTATIRETTTQDQAYIDAPYGVFSFMNHDADRLVLIAGGIGITPFMSMLRYMHDRGLERQVLLLWGNKAERDIVFRRELDEMAAAMPTLRVVHVLSAQPDWPGEKGYITAELIQRCAPEVAQSECFVCGPAIMMSKVLAALRQLGVPRRCMHYEKFALR